MAAPRRVFVAMPFSHVQGGSRDEARLTAFFQNNIKRPIEGASELAHDYRVYRSGQTFDITEQIIRDICSADIVIADLSGLQANPNVMYELGVRLAVSAKPVILIKEDIEDSKNPFDVFGYYTEPYDPLDYSPLERHLVEKIARIESGEEQFNNPVLRIVEEQLGLLQPDLTALDPDQQRPLVLQGVAAASAVVATAFGPHGRGLSVPERFGSGSRVETRGFAIAERTLSRNAWENEGAKLLAAAGRRIHSRIGDGSKAAILICAELIEKGEALMEDGAPRSDVAAAIEGVALSAIGLLSEHARDVESLAELALVASTAVRGAQLPVDLPGVLSEAGPGGLVLFEAELGLESRVEPPDGYVLPVGPMDEDFLNEALRADLDNPLVLLYPGRISMMADLVPALEAAAADKRSLVVVAKDIEGEALETLRVNHQKGVVSVLPIKLFEGAGPRADVYEDLAALTACEVVHPERRGSARGVLVSDLGSARGVTATTREVRIYPFPAARDGIERWATKLDQRRDDGTSDYDQEKLRERTARLRGNLFKVVAAAPSQEEALTLRQAFEEAAAACRSAEEKGVVIGAGATLVAIAAELRQRDGPDKVANECMATALEAPYRALLANAGAESHSKGETGEWVFDSHSRSFGAPEDAGLIDPLVLLEEAIAAGANVAARYFRTSQWAVSVPSRGSGGESVGVFELEGEKP